ncbi:protein-L-isoaspartate O-methyltransferase [Paenibacillus helianthi]|uniref:Protein-L-isoaspartate O-methyltransferase n=1 Tax=Paenibacillus helianthi TaxID=1349432 RepID=A0ABX3EN59_9BACL|nr:MULTISPECIES: PTS transporter subunit EIIC [Paenibacillus]OKP83711.1 protein-L-isoaspartate O-methyltransferase [Paenibacillus sp. P32E]OKP85978.1 protein-L-isoaspartate O-methyltransferase [Paenibacillus helianthi]
MEVHNQATSVQHSKKSAVNIIIDGISGIFLPIVNILSAAGIMKGLLAGAAALELISKTEGTYTALNAMADSLFYYLPILLAYTAARKFGANPFTAVVVAGVLLYPSLTTQFADHETIQFFGMGITPVNYPASAIPIILAVGLLVYVERICIKVLPEIIREFFTPLISIVVVSSVTLLVFGPMGTLAGDALAKGYSFVYHLSPVGAGMVLGAIIQPMVIFGLHWSLVPLAINNISLNGSDTLLALMGPASFAQAGAALAVFFKAKDKKFKTLSLSASISALFGVTEPAMFGVNLPLRKPMVIVCCAGAVGGGMAGMFGSSAISFAFAGLPTLPAYLGDGFGGFLIACATGFLIALIATLLIRLETEPGMDARAK